VLQSHLPLRKHFKEKKNTDTELRLHFVCNKTCGDRLWSAVNCHVTWSCGENERQTSFQMNTFTKKTQSSKAKLLTETGMAFSSVYMCFHKDEKFWYCNPLKYDVHLSHLSHCKAYLTGNIVRAHYKDHSASDVDETNGSLL
jgi:hypothetical protein